MVTSSNEKPGIIFVQALCKELPEERIREAEASFWAYLEILKRIAEQERARTASELVHSPDSTYLDSESLIQSLRD